MLLWLLVIFAFINLIISLWWFLHQKVTLYRRGFFGTKKIQFQGSDARVFALGQIYGHSFILAGCLIIAVNREGSTLVVCFPILFLGLYIVLRGLWKIRNLFA